MDIQNLLPSDLFLQVRGITPGRAAAIASALVGLTSIIIGRLAIIRVARRPNSGRTMSIAALVAALICTVLAVLHLASTTGGFGTGKGRAGAIVALLLGLTGLILAVLALVRSRRLLARSSRATAPIDPGGKT